MKELHVVLIELDDDELYFKKLKLPAKLMALLLPMSGSSISSSTFLPVVLACSYEKTFEKFV